MGFLYLRPGRGFTIPGGTGARLALAASPARRGSCRSSGSGTVGGRLSMVDDGDASISRHDMLKNMGIKAASAAAGERQSGIRT